MSSLEKTHNNTVPFRRMLPPNTAFIAKLVGIYATVISVVLMAGKGSSVEMMSSMVRNPELLFVYTLGFLEAFDISRLTQHLIDFTNVESFELDVVAREFFQQDVLIFHKRQKRFVEDQSCLFMA